jgi:hypothetical protein
MTLDWLAERLQMGSGVLEKPAGRKPKGNGNGNPSITGAATERVRFKLMSAESLRAVEKLWRNNDIAARRELVGGLPLGSYDGRDRL